MRNKNVIFYIIIFLIGTCIGKLIDWGYFELDKKISIVDSISLFVTIGLAFYISKIIDKGKEVKRHEKSLYFSVISELEDKLKIIEDIIIEEKILFPKILPRIHYCRILKNTIIENNRNIFNTSNKDIEIIEKDIQKKISKINNYLTYTPISDGNNDIVLINNVIKYSDSRINKIITEISSLKNSLFKLKMKINMC